MKHFLPYVLIITLCTSLSPKASASHMRGAEISYQATATPGIFEVIFVFYRECSGIPLCPEVCGGSCYMSLNMMGADPGYTSSNFGTVTVSLVNVRKIGAPPIECPAWAQSTCTLMGCNTPGYYPGIERYEFRGLVNLGPTSGIPAACCNVSFVHESCCRTNYGGAGFYLSGTINRCASYAPGNSAPVFTNDPVIDICAGPGYIYNLGAYDPDGDSLSYAFAPSRIDANTSVTYPAPFSPSTPMPWTGAATASYPSGISCNPRTGDVMATPDMTSGSNFNGVMVVEVKQWRTINGVVTLMGTTSRDVLVNITGGCAPNAAPEIHTIPPHPTIPSDPKTEWNFCAGQQTCFTVTATDMNFSPPVISDTTYLSWNGTISMAGTGATFLPTYDPANRRKPAPLGGPREDNYEFCWTPTEVQVREQPYVFMIAAKEGKCPSMATASRAFAIKVISIPNVSIAKNDLKCNNWTISCQTITPALPPTKIIWTISRNPEDLNLTQAPYRFYDATTTPVLNLKKAGRYVIRLEAENGNTGACPRVLYDTLVIDTPFGAVFNAPVSCAGISTGITATARGGRAPYAYRWYNSIADTALHSIPLNWPTFSSGNLSVTSDITRRYTLQLTDANGCRDYDSLMVVRSTSVKTPSLAHILCNGANTGRIEIKPTHPNTSYQYKLNNGAFQSSYIFDNLTAGTYDVLIEDTNGCTRSFAGLVLSEPAALLDSFITTSDETCFNTHNGTISIQGKGGIAPYTYRLDSGIYITGGTFNQLPGGIYQVQIKDANGCIFAATQTITKPDSINYSTGQTDISCFNGNDGSITITASGGIPPYNFQVDRGIFGNTGTFTNLPAGEHQLTIRDANGCSKTFMETLSQPAQLEYISAKTDATCFARNDGSVMIMPVGGILPYTYQTDGSLFDSIAFRSNLTEGLHGFTIKDANGCTLFFTETIVEPAPINAGTIMGNTDVKQDSIYTYEVSPLIGINYMWKVEKGTILSGQSTPSLNVKWDATGTGNISVLLYSDSACGNSSSLAVTITKHVGLEELASELGLNIFPNPAKNVLNITLKRLSHNNTLTLYDMQGKALLEQPVKEQQQLEIGHLPQGVYILKIGDWRGSLIKE